MIKKILKFLAPYAIMGLVIWTFYSAFHRDIYDLYKFVEFVITSPIAFILKQEPFQGVLYLSVIGVVFYLIKKFQQFWYGFFECLFAVANCYIQFTVIQREVAAGSTKITLWMTAIATIYLVVRGINNIDDGYKKKYFGKRAVEYLLNEILS